MLFNIYFCISQHVIFKLKSRKTLSNWLTNRYLLILRNEENFAEKTTISFTYAKLILITFLLLLIIMIGSLYLSSTLMAQWFDPRHELIIMDRHLVNLVEKVDSLEDQIRIKDQFIVNVQRVLIGEVIGDDSIFINEDKSSVNKLIDPIPAIDSQFRKDFETSELTFLTVSNPISQELADQYFYSPIEGMVTTEFNIKDEHYGIDIVSKSNEPVKSVAEGTVIFSDWTQESGNVIIIQHRGNIMSVYKHNSALLKKVGNFVSSGQVIAIIGNTGEFTSGPHLHFEMWYNGNPVDPEEFISF
ncbi:MAG: M23 family metallopeptidase [Cyclobacteriaceae bacterium]|nr:M23 family metallopeptidase [Cyclobacteriaceae bacterium]MCK5703475.1 M23 family metallopeptidase [Cyclobacteriaceae bacterium]